MKAVDFLILGQGLAGTTLAWQLRWRGFRVLILDRETEGTSSQIAAGLITPITGQRFVKRERYEELFASAEEFYRRVEAETNAAFF